MDYYGIINHLPLLDDDLPRYIYRCDLLPADIASMDEDIRNKHLLNAAVELRRGGDGWIGFGSNALWEIWEYESGKFYGLFKTYCQDRIDNDSELKYIWDQRWSEEYEWKLIYDISQKYYWNLRYDARLVFERHRDAINADIHFRNTEKSVRGVVGKVMEGAGNYFSDKGWVSEVENPESMIRVMSGIVGVQEKLSKIQSEKNNNGLNLNINSSGEGDIKILAINQELEKKITDNPEISDLTQDQILEDISKDRDE